MKSTLQQNFKSIMPDNMSNNLNPQIVPPPGVQPINPPYQQMHRPNSNPMGMQHNLGPPQHPNAQNHSHGAMFGGNKG